MPGLVEDNRAGVAGAEGGREDDGLEMVKRGPDHIGSSESCKRHWLSDLSKMFAVRVGGRGESGVGAG